MRFQNAVVLLSSGDMSGNLTSTSQDLQQMYAYAIQAVFTGSPVGSFKLQASVDGITYTDVANSTFAVTASGDIEWNVSYAGYRYVRVVYTRASGTGSLTIKLSAKGV